MTQVRVHNFAASLDGFSTGEGQSGLDSVRRTACLC
jgi:hypothetical protein